MVELGILCTKISILLNYILNLNVVIFFLFSWLVCIMSFFMIVLAFVTINRSLSDMSVFIIVVAVVILEGGGEWRKFFLVGVGYFTKRR